MHLKIANPRLARAVCDFAALEVWEDLLLCPCSNSGYSRTLALVCCWLNNHFPSTAKMKVGSGLVLFAEQAAEPFLLDLSC